MRLRWQIHYSTSVLLAFYMMTGRFAEYVIVVLSLIAHEMGHLLAARLTGVKVESVCFYMYGADLRFRTNFLLPRQQFLIACGGPIATCFILVVCAALRDGAFTEVIQIQKLLLFINLCPVWPLDGGRIIQAFIMRFSQSTNGELLFLKFSFVMTVMAAVVAMILIKPFFMLLAFIICNQIIAEMKQFPLHRAFKRLVLKNK